MTADEPLDPADAAAFDQALAGLERRKLYAAELMAAAETDDVERWCRLRVARLVDERRLPEGVTLTGALLPGMTVEQRAEQLDRSEYGADLLDRLPWLAAPCLLLVFVRTLDDFLTGALLEPMCGRPDCLCHGADPHDLAE